MRADAVTDQAGDCRSCCRREVSGQQTDRWPPPRELRFATSWPLLAGGRGWGDGGEFVTRNAVINTSLERTWQGEETLHPLDACLGTIHPGGTGSDAPAIRSARKDLPVGSTSSHRGQVVAPAFHPRQWVLHGLGSGSGMGGGLGTPFRQCFIFCRGNRGPDSAVLGTEEVYLSLSVCRRAEHLPASSLWPPQHPLSSGHEVMEAAVPTFAPGPGRGPPLYQSDGSTVTA